MAARKQQEQRETFEGLYAELEAKARKLEQGNLPLEESLQLYEEGAALVDRLREILDGAELRIRNVQGRFQEDVSVLREVEEEYGDEDDYEED